MFENYFGIIELVFSFGLVIVLCVWQLREIEKTRKRLSDEERRDGKRE
jgi:hypothetical protein